MKKDCLFKVFENITNIKYKIIKKEIQEEKYKKLKQ